MKRPKYKYHVMLGAGAFGGLTSFIKAKKAVTYWREKGCLGVEVERVLVLPSFAKQYWRWRNNRWSFEDHYKPSPEDLAFWA